MEGEEQSASSEIDERTGLKKKPPSGYMMGIMNHLKCCLGSGIFALGFAFKSAGMAIAPPLLILLGCLQLHCQHMLIEAGRETEKSLGRRPDFAETGRGAFEYGPEKLKKWQKTMHIACNVIFNLTTAGLLCIYIVFFADSMKRVAENWDYTSLGIQMWVLIAFPPVLISSSALGDLRLVGGLSLFANILVLIGVLLTIYMTTTNLPDEFTFKWVEDLTKLPMFISVTMMAYSVAPVVLPIYIESKNPEKVDSFFGILNIATLIEIFVNVLIGVLSYMKYGKDCKGSITLNFEFGIVSQLVVLIVGIEMMLSYTLIMYVTIEALFPVISAKWGPFRYPNLGVFLFRFGCIILTFILAWTLPLIAQIVSLVGAFGSISINIVLPTIFHLAIMWEKTSIALKVKDFLIIILGIFCVIAGIVAAIRDIVAEIDKVYNPTPMTTTAAPS